MNLKRVFASYWFRSAFYSILQRFSLIFLGFASFFLLIRSLTVPQMATWALFLTITTILENTKSALLKNAHIKYVSACDSAHEKAAIASSSMLINASISFVFLLLILLAGRQISFLLNAEQDLYMLLLWFIPGIIGLVFFAHLEAVQQSHFDFKGVFAGNLVRQICFVTPIALHFILKKPMEIYQLGLYQSVSILTGTLVLFLFSRKYLLLKFNPTRAWSKIIVNYGGYIFGTGVVSNIYSNLDQIMTAAIIPGSAAFYNAAKRINGFIDVPTYAAADIAFPKLAAASVSEGPEKIKYMFEKIVSVIFSVIIPLAVLVIIFAKQVILIIAGPAYLTAAPILQSYMLISIAGVIQHQASTTLYSLGKTKLCFFINTASLLLNLVVTFVCLKLIGFYGAAIAALITSGISTIVWFIVIKKEISFSISTVPLYCKQYYITAFLYAKSQFLKLKKAN